MNANDIILFINQRPGWQIALYFSGVNIVAFLAYGWDKRAAIERGWRVSESTLLMLGLIGGSPGAFLGQTVFRHKTRKQPFQTYFWLIVVGQILAILWLGLLRIGYI